tara:strand:+ start:819 stop:1199 length:381 start_codon:yes stop_codon:yes gene_type:complete
MTAFEQAWTFLKANPAMHDGLYSVHPAAMDYGYAARMAEVMRDEQNKRGRFPSSYLRLPLDVGERAADFVQGYPYFRQKGKNITSFDMRHAYAPDGMDLNIQRTPRDEVEHPNKDEQNMMHTGEQQ